MKSNTNDIHKVTMQTVDRALELINYITNSDGGMTAIELSKALGITRTSTYNILNSLMNENYVERDESSGKYCIGYKFLEIGSLYRYRYPFAAVAERHMEQIDPSFQGNVGIYKSPMKVLMLLIRESPVVSRNSSMRTFPASASACGKVLLANMAEKDLDEQLAQAVLRRYAKNTILDMDRLREELEQIRHQGYAIEDEELLPGRSCFAAPIMGVSGKVIASLSIGGDRNCMMEKKDQCITMVMDIAHSISTELGFNFFG